MAAYTTIDDPELYFQTHTWTGDGSSKSFTFTGEENMQPDLLWTKPNAGHEHSLVDAVRGVDNNRLNVDINNAEDTTNSHGHYDSLDSNGFTVTYAGGGWNVNRSSVTYRGWAWKAGAGSGSSNTAGSINTTSTSVNTTSKFSISTYTGNDTAGATFGHGLGAVPHFIIIKCRNAAQDWVVYHHKNTAAPETDYLLLNTTDATADNANRWNDTAPTSTLITLGDENQSNGALNYVAYAWSEVQGLSKFSSYTGNGDSSDGTFVYLGFRPAFVIQKATGATEQWTMYDNKALGYNPDNNFFYPNANTAEQTDDEIDFLSNGFKWRSNSGRLNTSGGAYIYMAWAEQPFVNSNGVPCNAR